MRNRTEYNAPEHEPAVVVDRPGHAGGMGVHDGVAVHEDLTIQEDRVVGATWWSESLPARVSGIVFTLLLALEGLLAVRFALVAFAANRTSGFVDFILDISYPFVRPFTNAFVNRTWDQGIIEVSTLLAMGVWFLVFALVALVLNAIVPNMRSSETRVHRERGAHL